ncbi:MAG: ribonuclease R [bacterium]
MGKKLKGKIDRHERGFGFLIPEDEGIKDIFIPPGRLRGALDGDTVLVETRASKRGKNPVGEVVTILERGFSRLIGTVRITKERTVVIPDTVRLGKPVRVPHQAGSSRVKDGELVEVEIESYEPLQGIIIDVLGAPGDPAVEEKVLLKKYELEPDFEKELQKEAEQIPVEISDEEIARRRDLRDLPVIAIDPVDAKDRDDAVSLEFTRSGNYRVGVHITDVSHYIKPGSKLDDEARERGTSTYLADRVIPMFPFQFSNGTGSLQEGKDRLALSVFLIVDPSGRVVDAQFEETVINLTACLSYGDVDKYLDESVLDAPEELKELIDNMVDVSQKIRARRMERGSLDFDLPEVHLKFSDGRVEEIIPVEHTRSHQLIEEFMIGANEAVAGYLTSKKTPLLYRIHETPASEDVEEFTRFIRGLGYSLPAPEKVTPKDFQRVLKEAHGTTTENIVAWNMLRSLQKARYSVDNAGHFGLASTCYCHYTSPIRRYPDLVVHRVLKETLRSGRLQQERKKVLSSRLEELARHTSECEQNATKAERESVNVKLLEYMKDKVGEQREAYISSVLNFGCFVQLENTLEGLIHVSTLDDYFVYNDEDYSLIGERTGQSLHMGDKVLVEITRVDIPSRELDFKLIEVLESHFSDTDG